MTKRHADQDYPEPKRQHQITADEAKLYDRQIRLWGMEAQQRMRNARILCIGITGLANEVLKNIVLAGVHSIGLLDSRKVVAKDLGSQFLIREQDVGKMISLAVVPQLKTLNPRVEFRSLDVQLTDLDSTLISEFDIVCDFGSPIDQLLRIDKICSDNRILFWAGKSMGYHSFIFANLHKFTFTAVKKQSGVGGEKVTTTERVLQFPSLSNVLNHKFSMPDISIKGGKRWAKSVDPIYFAILIIWEFNKIHRKNPLIKDKNELLKLKTKVLGRIEVDEKILQNETLMQIVKTLDVEVTPTCAIVGGFFAQEIFKGLARSETPFYNFFCHNSFESTANLMKVVDN